MADILYKGNAIKGVRGVAFPAVGGGEAVFYEKQKSGPSVEVEELSVTANGEYTAPSGKAYSPVTVSVPWDFMGVDAEKVSTPFTHTYALEDTDYVEPTGTTAQVIVPSSDLTAVAINTGDYEYILRWMLEFDPVFTSGVTTKALPIRQVVIIYQNIFKRPYNKTAYDADNWNSNTCATMGTIPAIIYYNTSGTVTVGYTASYGVYDAAVAATFSSSTSNTPNLTMKTPTISMRTNNTYFNTARAPYFDTENTKIKLTGELWRMSKGGEFRSMYGQAVDLLRNPT